MRTPPHHHRGGWLGWGFSGGASILAKPGWAFSYFMGEWPCGYMTVMRVFDLSSSSPGSGIRQGTLERPETVICSPDLGGSFDTPPRPPPTRRPLRRPVEQMLRRTPLLPNAVPNDTS